MSDFRFMKLALSLGRRGQGRTWPNPAVGCVTFTVFDAVVTDGSNPAAVADTIVVPSPTASNAAPPAATVVGDELTLIGTSTVTVLAVGVTVVVNTPADGSLLVNVTGIGPSPALTDCCWSVNPVAPVE